MAYLLGIDASTQSVSALLFDPEANRVAAEVSVSFGEDLPHYAAPQGFIPGGPEGEVHADPRMWLDGLDLCLQRLADTGSDLTQVIAVSGAGQQHGTVYLNRKGLGCIENPATMVPLKDPFEGGFSRPTSPIWMDTSTSAECREIEDALGGAMEVCRRSGSVAIERFSGPQIRRFAKNDPEAYGETVRIHLVSSFLASVLAGRDAPIDFGDGAGMNLLNLESLDWDPALLEATAPNLRDKLPQAAPSATVIGTVVPYFEYHYGIPSTARVVAFTGDNPSSLVGMGGTNPGTVIVSLGTSDTFFAAMEEPHTDPEGCGHVFGNPLGGFMTLQCFVNGSLAREKVRDRLGLNWEGFSKAITESQPGCGGRLLLPFFQPEISPRLDRDTPLSSGFADGWEKDPVSVRAAVEGQFLNMKRASAWMQLDPAVIYLTGGASQNDAIARIAADIFGCPVQRLKTSGSVALGAAFRTGLATGEYERSLMEAFFQSGAKEADPIEPDHSLGAIYQQAGKKMMGLFPKGKPA